MGLIHRVPWTVQPQYAAPNNPQYSLLFAATPHHDYASQGTGAGKAITEKGIGVTLNGSTAGRALHLPGKDVAGRGELSILCYRRVASSGMGSSYVPMMAEAGAALWRFGIYFLAGVGVAAFRHRNVTTGDSGAGQNLNFPASVGGQDEVLIGTYSVASNVKNTWRNGVFGSTSTAPTAMTSTVSSHVGFGTLELNAVYAHPSPIYLIAISARAWTDTEVKALSVNPWLLFAPQQRYLFAPPSGGTTYTLTADSGSIAITGTAASLKFNRVLAADGGSIAVTGTDATLTYSGAGAPTYTLTAEGGSVAITGTAASLKFNRLLACDAGSIVITGAAATLTYSGASGFTVDQLAYLDAKFAAVLAAIPSAATTATAVLAAAATTPIQADVRKVVGITVDGTGTDGDPWGPQ